VGFGGGAAAVRQKRIGLNRRTAVRAMGIGLAAAVEIVKRSVDAKAQFRSLAEPWADTGTSTGRLMLAVLRGLADVKRDLIRTRTAEGRSRTQQREQHMG
jgi:DNA invertase Pin-like site-specific DNA recombinase